jgi:hypothetical protein
LGSANAQSRFASSERELFMAGGELEFRSDSREILLGHCSRDISPQELFCAVEIPHRPTFSLEKINGMASLGQEE